MPAAVTTVLGVGLFLAGGLGLTPQGGDGPAAQERPAGQDSADTGPGAEIRGLQDHP
ncbi:hypothetical protein [Kitasatospora cineracea]|uniref:Uncharacterized protein n=1 Tax=Kitasatospora cineracea TaxID=88074 RepID=A0A8G1UMR9_9ACTN|nr:hypothetical protein [Kitasatospora cineracea]ROR46975.1 hypothetical protein EDD39_5284 [Kitasatospora cineracea]